MKLFCNCIGLYVVVFVVFRNLSFFAISPALAAVGDPFSHFGVETVSAHRWILTVGVEQLLQGGQPLLLSTLSRHALQVINDHGGRNLPCENTETILYRIF